MMKSFWKKNPKRGQWRSVFPIRRARLVEGEKCDVNWGGVLFPEMGGIVIRGSLDQEGKV